MELRDIEIFLTLAEELHFGRTAERLHLTPARVSQSIKKQERRFGAPLFDRNSRVVRLTELGEHLRTDLVPGYRQIQDAVAKASAAGRGIVGMLRAGYSAAWCGDLFMAATEAFQADHPDCEVEIRQVPIGDLFGGLRSGQLDLVLVPLPVDEPDITNGPVMFSHQRALHVSSDHPLAQRRSVSREDLAGLPFVQLQGAPQYFLDYHVPTRTPSGKDIGKGPSVMVWEDILAVIAAGTAVAAGSVMDAQFHSRPGVTTVPFRDALPVEYALLWPTNAETPKVKAFVKAILDTQAPAAPAE